MVARAGPRKSSCNAGELISDIAGRPDIKQYYSGGLRFKHLEPVPQSGFRLMPGTDDFGPVRAAPEAVAITGTTDDLGPHATAAVIREITFDAATIDGVHVEGLKVDTGTFTFTIEIWTGGAWVAITDEMTGGTSAVSRFAAFAPGAGKSATKARISVTPGEAQTYSLDGLTPYAPTGDQATPRYIALPVDKETGYFFAVGNGFADIWNQTTWVAAVLVPEVTAARVSEIGYYGELYTVGIFHSDPAFGVSRRIRRGATDHEWTVDDWPYTDIPGNDYGDVYPKTDDVWDVFFRWTGTPLISVQVTVNGEATPALAYEDGTAAAIAIDETTAYWDDWVDRIATAINDLPSMPGGVTGAHADVPGAARRMIFTFGGDSSGVEYDFTILVVNTADASALPSHTTIGDTEYEPLISATRGWPADVALVQDRLAYYGMYGEKSALMLSQTAEYFNLNIEATGDNAARLDKPRGSGTSEEILHVKEARYNLVFTNIGVYFITNRTISRNEPLDFVIASEIGIAPGTIACDLEQKTFYVSREQQDDDDNEYPGQVYSLTYDEVSTNFNALPESLLAAHLVSDIIRNARQKPAGERDTARMWMLRADGRLVCAKMIRSQEILGIVEWLSAGSLVREMNVDHFNTAWLATERDNALRHERMNPNRLFRQTVTTTTDLAGLVSDLPFPDGAEIWADADGYILGPFTVSGGSIDLGQAFTTVRCGYWTAPIFEDMPHIHVLPNDEVIERPGRISSVYAAVRDTTSIAIGANNTDPEDVPLVSLQDPGGAPPLEKTETVARHGILGRATGTTVVITQVKPGKLQVRNYHVEEKL